MNREESARIITARKIDGFRRITSVTFDINGVSPALTTPSGGGVIPKIIEYEERRTENRELLTRQERED